MGEWLSRELGLVSSRSSVGGGGVEGIDMAHKFPLKVELMRFNPAVILVRYAKWAP